MKKLLQINVTSNWGAIGRIAEGIGLSALQKGWESYIFFGRYHNQSQSSVTQFGNNLDVYTHYLKNRILDGEGLGSKVPTKNLIKKIEEIKPDIIQLHDIHDHWINYPILFEHLTKIKTPIVWSFHDCWAFTGGCYHFETIGCYKWKTHCRNCKYRELFQMDQSFRNFKLKKECFGAIKDRLTIVGVSNWITDLAKQSFLKDSKFYTIHNGIDLSIFQNELVKENYILGVSNIWNESKGLNDFINLRKLLSDKIGMVLIGLNKNQIKKLPKGIIGIERTDSKKELVRYYQKAKVFVNPTYNDTFPTVNLEALACGTPVLTYKTGGSPEAIDHKTGLVIEKGDIKSLSDSIKKIILGEISFDSKDCRSRAEIFFNQKIQYNKYIDLYESLLLPK